MTNVYYFKNETEEYKKTGLKQIEEAEKLGMGSTQYEIIEK